MNTTTNGTVNRPRLDNILSLSTSHVEPTTLEGIQNRTFELHVAPHSYGGMVYVPGHDAAIQELDIPEDLKCVLIFALRRGCLWLNLDADTPVLEGTDLPTY